MLEVIKEMTNWDIFGPWHWICQAVEKEDEPMMKVNRAHDPMPDWFLSMNWDNPDGLEPILQSPSLTPDVVERKIQVLEIVC